MRIVQRLQLGCPVEQAWELIHEPRNLKLWMKDLVQCRRDGGTGAGTHQTWTLQEGGRQKDHDVEITVFDPPHHLRLKLHGSAYGDHPIHIDYRLREVDRDACRLDYAFTAEVQGVVRTLLAPLYTRSARRQVEDHMLSLKTLAGTPVESMA